MLGEFLARTAKAACCLEWPTRLAASALYSHCPADFAVGIPLLDRLAAVHLPLAAAQSDQDLRHPALDVDLERHDGQGGEDPDRLSERTW